MWNELSEASSSAPMVSIDELSVAQWQAVLDTTLTGVFLRTRVLVRLVNDEAVRRVAASHLMRAAYQQVNTSGK